MFSECQLAVGTSAGFDALLWATSTPIATGEISPPGVVIWTTAVGVAAEVVVRVTTRARLLQEK